MSDQKPEKAAITPPNNLAAEAAVLGAILFDNNVYQFIADILTPPDFYAPAHREVYAVAANMIQTGRVADGVTLREYFEHREKLAEIGGAKYLVDLLDAAAFGPDTVSLNDDVEGGSGALKRRDQTRCVGRLAPHDLDSRPAQMPGLLRLTRNRAHGHTTLPQRFERGTAHLSCRSHQDQHRRPPQVTRPLLSRRYAFHKYAHFLY